MDFTNMSGTPKSDRYDALVIGAGLAGSTTAILLAHAGWRVALVEKQRFPRRKVCGECLAASNLPLLHALGIGDTFDAAAGPELRYVAYLRGADRINAALPTLGNGPSSFGKALGRETLDDLLLEQARACGVDIFQPFALQSIGGNPGDWRCVLRPVRRSSDRTPSLCEIGSDIECRAAELIDAHGSWEALPVPVTAPMGEDHRTPRRASDLLAFKANFHNAIFERGHIGVIALDGGYGGIVEADGGVTTVACCIQRGHLDRLRDAAPGKRAGDVIDAWIRASCLGVATSLEGSVRQGSWLGAGPIQPGIRVDRHDGILRVGNAAGEAHPILGEGMSMALQGAALLADTLLQPARRRVDNQPVTARQRSAVHRRYARAWRRAFAPRLRIAAIIAHTSMRPAAASVNTQLLQLWPGALTQIARWGGKTTSPSIASHLTPFPVHLQNQEFE